MLAIEPVPYDLQEKWRKQGTLQLAIGCIMWILLERMLLAVKLFNIGFIVTSGAILAIKVFTAY